MRIGIRPINDFAFKKIFGTTANKLALISFLNAALRLRIPIVDITIVNPYNLQDFLDDKLSIACEIAGCIGFWIPMNTNRKRYGCDRLIRIPLVLLVGMLAQDLVAAFL